MANFAKLIIHVILGDTIGEGYLYGFFSIQRYWGYMPIVLDETQNKIGNLGILLSSLDACLRFVKFAIQFLEESSFIHNLFHHQTHKLCRKQDTIDGLRYLCYC